MSEPRFLEVPEEMLDQVVQYPLIFNSVSEHSNRKPSTRPHRVESFWLEISPDSPVKVTVYQSPQKR